ncbi:MAG: Hsp70 family protein [Anaerolineae bacterium]|nr:Hsp70 family protein [Anaerolineae bacterium]
MIVGMDFGTTNSGMAVYDGQELRRLPLDPSSENPRVVRSALYITNEQDVFIGRDAIDRYFGQNVGRPTKLERVWVGEIEVRGADMYFVTDAYVWADVMSPGRLFLSFKTNLRDHQYTGTVIGNFFYRIEALLALYFYVTRQRAQKLLGRDVHEVVLGRPVHFADDPQHDTLAQERLLRGAFAAGYERVYLQREPIAAAHHYANLTQRAQNILVFDFGGGTLDITVMRLGNGERDVLATGGVPLAGDVFDQKLVRAQLPRHFGEGSTYGSKEMPIPHWIYDTFANWQTILELQTPQNRRVLEEIAETAKRPRDIRALISLVSSNYGLQMFDTVEQAKRDLSERFGGMIRLEGPGFDVTQLVTRREFENIIRPEYLRIEQHLDETVRASGLRPEQIDAVIRTGGSAEIPLFQKMLQQKFGAERLHAIDTFGSVTAGLGIIAHGIGEGKIAAHAYTPEDLTQTEVARQPEGNGNLARPQVGTVNLEVLKRRIDLYEGGDNGHDVGQTAFVLLTAENEVRVAIAADEATAAAELADTAHAGFPSLMGAVVGAPDDRLLLVTSRYRFLLVPAIQLEALSAVGQSLEELYQFAAREAIFALANWEVVKHAARMVVATSLGYVRAFRTALIREAIEAPVPLTFEQPPPGWPIAVCGAAREERILLFTAAGRGIGYPLEAIPGTGMQLLNRADDDTIVAAVTAPESAELLVMTEDGHARRLPVTSVHVPEKANHKGRVLVSRRPVVTAAIAEEPLRVLTSRGMAAVDVNAAPLEPASTRSTRLLRHGEIRLLLKN